MIYIVLYKYFLFMRGGVFRKFLCNENIKNVKIIWRCNLIVLILSPEIN